MIKSLHELLEYQKIDIQLRKILDEIERHEDNRKMEQAKAEFNNAKGKIAESERAAESIIHFYNNSQAYYEENSKKVDEIAAQLAATQDEQTRRDLIAQVETLKEKFAELERKLAERREKSDKVIQAYLDANDKGKKMREIYAAVKARLDAFKKEREPQIRQLQAQLAAIRGKIDAEVMKQYEMLTSERKYPAFVPALSADNGKNYRCFCGITLSQKLQSELKENGHCRCETCRRVIYKE